MKEATILTIVIPAPFDGLRTGTQGQATGLAALGSRFRGNDEKMVARSAVIFSDAGVLRRAASLMRHPERDRS